MDNKYNIELNHYKTELKEELRYRKDKIGRERMLILELEERIENIEGILKIIDKK